MMSNEIAGLAALSLLEALLVELTDRGVLREDQVEEIIVTSIEAHRSAQPQMIEHVAAAELLERLRTGSNSVRKG